jgi:uncharacterized alpha/beta hydrolase family protein
LTDDWRTLPSNILQDGGALPPEKEERPMVRLMRSARIKHGGKAMEALAFAKEIANYSEKKYGQIKVDVCLDSFGATGTIRWFVDYDDLATFEKVQSQVLADPEYWKLIGKAAAADLFIEGSAEDVMMRKI